MRIWRTICFKILIYGNYNGKIQQKQRKSIYPACFECWLHSQLHEFIKRASSVDAGLVLAWLSNTEIDWWCWWLKNQHLKWVCAMPISTGTMQWLYRGQNSLSWTVFFLGRMVICIYSRITGAFQIVKQLKMRTTYIYILTCTLFVLC